MSLFKTNSFNNLTLIKIFTPPLAFIFSCTRWFGIWLDWIALTFIAVITIVFVFTATSGPEVGLVISSAMLMMGDFQWGVRQEVEVENLMVSTERVFEYAQLESEAALISSPDKKPRQDWPQEGQIRFEKVCMKFGDHNVLTDITFTVKASEKIGIVGRTGAGKSTLVSVLFRLAEPTGAILIDDVNTTEIGLHDLRKIISIIPQDPILFSGSIRKNLDPFDSYTDTEVWNALEYSHLANEVRALPQGLNALISEGGSNFSVGQRQLFCLGRAILKNNKILVLDEATANVDLQTDHLIQKTIQTQFASATVLTIAHRLHTVMDLDKILVLDAGKVLEYDEPHKLLQDENSSLRNLVEQTGPDTAKDLMKQAAAAHDKRQIENKKMA